MPLHSLYGSKNPSIKDILGHIRKGLFKYFGYPNFAYFCPTFSIN